MLATRWLCALDRGASGTAPAAAPCPDASSLHVKIANRRMLAGAAARPRNGKADRHVCPNDGMGHGRVRSHCLILFRPFLCAE